MSTTVPEFKVVLEFAARQEALIRGNPLLGIQVLETWALLGST